MKTLFLIAGVVFLSCGSSKNNNNNTAIQEPRFNDITERKLPGCLQKMIRQYGVEEKQNPPKKIYSYLYKGKTVYYVTPPCCDFFSELYDENCVLIGHPDGGITGRGDGTVADFKDSSSNEQLVWQDQRK